MPVHWLLVYNTPIGLESDLMVRLHMTSGATMRYSNFRKDERSGEAFLFGGNMDNSKHKLCARCRNVFFKRKRDSEIQWNNREYCSRSCINKGRIKITLMDRFMALCEPVPFSGCWIWIGSTDGKGYGHMATTHNRSPKKAYRISYELFNGNIPLGFVVRHKCDVRCCVNPNHLEIGTQKDNMQDASKRGRLNPLSLLNLRPGKKGILGAGTKSIKEIMQCQTI